MKGQARQREQHEKIDKIVRLINKLLLFGSGFGKICEEAEKHNYQNRLQFYFYLFLLIKSVHVILLK